MLPFFRPGTIARFGDSYKRKNILIKKKKKNAYMPHQTVTLLRELGKRLKPGTQTPQKYKSMDHF